MHLELSPEAVEFGNVVKAALADLGGTSLVEDYNADPAPTAAKIGSLLEQLGVWELDCRNPTELEAASQVCRSVGYWALPYPAAERLSRPRDLAIDGLSVIEGPNPALPLAGLDLEWAAVDLAGTRRRVTPTRGKAAPFRLAPLVGVGLSELDDDGAGDVPLALTLPSWTLVGLLDRAIELTRDYVLVREQFGQTLSRFTNVRFDLTETVVARNGAEELGYYALWSLARGLDHGPGLATERLADALAFRLSAVDAAETVFPIAHQLHGAIGFCDETPISWVSRMSQIIRRRPFAAEETARQLERVVGSTGLPGLFDDLVSVSEAAAGS